METIYEKFKPKSKFLAIVAKINKSGLATEDGANPGVLPGTAPVVPGTALTPGASIPNPALAQAQDKLNKDAIDLKKKQKIQAQQDINTVNSGMGQIKNQLNSQDPAQKAAAQAQLAAANAKLQQAQTIMKQP